MQGQIYRVQPQGLASYTVSPKYRLDLILFFVNVISSVVMQVQK